MTACLSHCREAPALLLQLCSGAKEDTQLCKIRQRGCPMSVWGRWSGCQVAGSQRGTARRGLCSSAAPAADPVPPNRIYFTIFHPRTSNILDSGSQTGILSNASIGPEPARCCRSWSIFLIILSLGLVTVHPSRPFPRVPKVVSNGPFNFFFFFLLRKHFVT